MESVYENALSMALASKGHKVEQQKALRVHFRNAPVGIFFADLVIEGTVIVELKAARALTLEHEAQVIHYLKASGMDVGLLLNFGKPRLEIRRLSRSRPRTR